MISPIGSTLADLCRVSGIKGSCVITTDGIMVASEFNGVMSDDAIAGLISFLTTTLQRVLRDADMAPFTRFRMHSTHGTVVVDELYESYLIVLINQFGDIEACLPEIDESAGDLRRQSRISM